MAGIAENPRFKESAVDKFNQLSMGEKAVVVGGVLLFLSSFFAWWSWSEGPFSVSQDGWSAPGSIWGVLLILIGIVMAGVVLATKLGNVQMPALPAGWTWGMVFGGGAALAVVLLLLKAWRIMAVDGGGFGVGFFIGLVATAILAYGGYVQYGEDKGGGFASLRKQ